MEAANILDAASQGASTAIMLVLNIGASLVAFLAFVEFVNQIISKHVPHFKYSMSLNTFAVKIVSILPYRLFL